MMITEKTLLMMLNDRSRKKKICLSNNFRICFGIGASRTCAVRASTVAQLLPFMRLRLQRNIASDTLRMIYCSNSFPLSPPKFGILETLVKIPVRFWKDLNDWLV